MKLIVIMDSGKEYFVDSPEYNPRDFVNSFYSETKMPMGGATVKVMKNGFMYLDEDEKIMFNPSHVSYIEILD